MYAAIILITLLVDLILSIVSDVLNLKHMTGALPKEFEGVYDAEKYQKSQDYTRVNTRFSWISSAFSLAISLIFWFAGGFNWLDLLILQWHLHPIWNGIIYMGMLMAARSVLSLPFTIYGTFVIEERFGFNKTTLKTFILDLLKGLALSIVIGVPILAAVLAFFQYAGNLAWLYCWGLTTLFSLFIQYIAPTWIMPLFNKFTPLKEGELLEKVMAYAKKVEYKLAGIFVIDGSRRSTKSNAFFTGFGKNKRIALYDTLIEKHTTNELVAVLAHEIGHYKKKHVVRGMLISIAHTGVMFFLLSLFLTQPGLFKAFYMEHMPLYAGFLFFGMLYSPVEMLLSLVMNIVSRKHEYEADTFAAETTRDPAAMIDALKKLSVHNLSNLQPHPFYVFLNYSHPPVLERIQHLRGLEKEITAES